ncbi:hypothetical protein C0Q70_08053 [Pomacea canaliculata]|uniref:EF-hand domain-containing protein n=1 Tax=Pomacea canaliculata TaxID=400727 RepID=A0A2T7PGS7_POMCA|nr:calmodulin-like isoform X2 [Pomacea canaliculata]PVD32611.1 hypothetical protein C0Q70_08053 [Pomacea canaliculata]
MSRKGSSSGSGGKPGGVCAGLSRIRKLSAMDAPDRCQREKPAVITRSRSSDIGSTGSEIEAEPPQHETAIILTDEQKAELKQAFSMFEKAGKGKIQVRDLGELLRCLGWNPSEQDLEEARHELEVTARGTISFADVEAYIARRGGIYYGNNAEEDILVAFQVLDKSGNGKIEVEEFRHFMTTMGERMTNEEVEDLLRSARRDGEEFIEYKDLMRAMQQHPT